MCVRNRVASIVWKAIIVVVGIAGLIESGSKLPAGEFFFYFTSLSVMAAVAYFALSIVMTMRSGKGSPWSVWAPTFKYLVTIAVTVTFLIAHFLLGGGLGTLGWEAYCLHYIVPIMTILDWLLFDPKGNMRRTDPFVWPLSMVSYFVYVLVMVYGFGVRMGGSLLDSRFPYAFIDIDALGVGQVAITVVVLVVAFVVLGYVFFGVDTLLARLASRRGPGAHEG